MTLDEKLDHFYASVIDNATKQNIEIVDEYKRTLDQHFNECKEVALRKAESNYRMAYDNIQRERNKKLSGETIEIKRRYLERTTELEDSLFSDVEEKLADFMKTNEYIQLLTTMIKNACEFAKDDDMTIYINSTDEDKKDSLESLTGITLTVSDRDFIGGIRAVIPSHSILIDNSFLTKLEDAKSSFTF